MQNDRAKTTLMRSNNKFPLIGISIVQTDFDARLNRPQSTIFTSAWMVRIVSSVVASNQRC